MAFELINALSSKTREVSLLFLFPDSFFLFLIQKRRKIKEYLTEQENKTFSTSNKCLCDINKKKKGKERIFYYYIINYIMRKVTTHIRSLLLHEDDDSEAWSDINPSGISENKKTYTNKQQLQNKNMYLSQEELIRVPLL